MLQNNKGHALLRLRRLPEAESTLRAALYRTVSELSTRFSSSPGCASAAAWREAALPAFQPADAALSNLYTVAWRSSATIATRFSEPAYRANAILRLRGLYYATSQIVYENAQQYLSGLEPARGSEECGGSAPIMGPLATPQVPPACTPSPAPATPARGWRFFLFANPAWMDRFQILRDSFSPLVFSQLDARLAVFVPSGFVRLDAEGH